MRSLKEKYYISEQEWKNIQEDLIKSARLFPTTLGAQVRSLKDLKKAAQWRTWVHILSPVLLKGRLAEPYYSQWITLTKAFRIATDTSITSSQLKFIETTIRLLLNTMRKNIINLSIIAYLYVSQLFMLFSMLLGVLKKWVQCGVMVSGQWSVWSASGHQKSIYGQMLTEIYLLLCYTQPRYTRSLWLQTWILWYPEMIILILQETIFCQAHARGKIS